MEWSKEKYEANMLKPLDEMTSRFGMNLYGGFILAVDHGQIRAEVYKKGKWFYCFLNLLVPWSDAGWVRSGKCYTAEEAVADAVQKAGYEVTDVPTPWWANSSGSVWLTRIGQEFGDNFRLFSFGRV